MGRWPWLGWRSSAGQPAPSSRLGLEPRCWALVLDLQREAMLVSIQPWVPEFDLPKRDGAQTGMENPERDGVPELAGSQVTLYKQSCLSSVGNTPRQYNPPKLGTGLTESTQNVQEKGFETWV